MQNLCGIFKIDLTWAHNLVLTDAHTHGDYDKFSKETFERYDNFSYSEKNSQKQSFWGYIGVKTAFDFH